MAQTEKIIDTLKEFGFDGVTKDTTAKKMKEMGINNEILGLAIISMETPQFFDLALKGAFPKQYKVAKKSDMKAVEGHDNILLSEQAAPQASSFLNSMKEDEISFKPTSGWRSVKKQADLKKAAIARNESHMAAAPLHSNHGTGSAIDIREFNAESSPKVYEKGLDNGFVPTIPHIEYWHFDYSPRLAEALKETGIVFKRDGNKAKATLNGTALSSRDTFDFIEKTKQELSRTQETQAPASQEGATAAPASGSTPTQPNATQPTERYTRSETEAGTQQGEAIMNF